MNLFARSMGGLFGDKAGIKWGLKGRVGFLGIVLFCEGIALILFSQMGILPMAIISMIIFSLFVQMAEGATFSVVPFINKKALGAVSGIVWSRWQRWSCHGRFFNEVRKYLLSSRTFYSWVHCRWYIHSQFTHQI